MLHGARNIALPVLVTVLGTLTSSPARQNPQRAPEFRVAVNLVRVDVIVTDRGGGIPSDLRAEDFRVYESGAQQQIQNFEVMRGAGGGFDGSPGARRDPSLLLLVVDNLNSNWANLAQMGEALEGFITRSLGPQDLVGIVSVSHAPRLVQNFTTNRKTLVTSVRAVLGRSLQADLQASGANQVLNQARLEESTAEYTSSNDDLAEAELARQEAARLVSWASDYSARNALSTLISVCESLGRFRGRKTVVYISEGVSPTSSVDSLLTGVVNAANRANVSVYTMDPRGLEFKDPAQAAELATKPRQRTFQSTGNVIAGNTDFDVVRLEARLNQKDDGLSMLSSATGGLAFRRSNGFRAFLDQVSQESRSYFQLGYAPSNPIMDGKFRRIEVKLLREGYTVRARKGYYATDNPAGLVGSAEDQMHQALRSPRRIEQLATSVTPALFLDPAGNGTVVVALKLAPENTAFSGAADRRTGEYRLLAAAFDETGNSVEEYRRDYKLALDAQGLERFRREGASVSFSWKLPAGKYEIKTVLRETETGRVGVERQEVEVLPYSRAAPALSSLVLAETIAPRGAARSGKDYDPLVYGSAVVTPSASREFGRAGQLQVYFHAYNVADASNRGRSPYQYQMTLLRDGVPITQSKPLPLETSASHPLGGFLQTSRLSLAPLDPGSYALEVALSLPDGRNRTARSVSFRVR